MTAVPFFVKGDTECGLIILNKVPEPEIGSQLLGSTI